MVFSILSTVMRIGQVLKVFLVICAARAQAFAEKSKIVRTTSGNVRGYKEDGIYSFYSIPYATAPTGADKFKGPLPAPLWLDTFEAVDKKIACLQGISTIPDIKKQEDCLIANVFVPDTDETQLPVVVYVHGGSYQVGHGNLMTPKSLVNSKKVIVVTFNYRLGAHGFLCLGTDDVPGNAGLKDQVALLRWVQKNIAYFGGNPDDVTLAGYSAGSSAVDLLMLSKSTKGLFNKVIAESGANVAVWSMQLDPLKNAKEFASTLNFTNVDDVYALEQFYKTAPADLLYSDTFLVRPDSTYVFTPCVERSTKNEIFLDDAPVNIMRSGKYNKVPLLYGFANMEGLFRVSFGFDVFVDKMNDKFSDFLPADLEFESEAQKKEVAEQVKKFYFGDKFVGDDTIFSYIDYFSDVIFTYPMLRSLAYHAAVGNNQVYLYEYAYPHAQKMLPPSIKTNIKGAHHCAQTMTVLDGNPQESENEEYKRVRKILIDLWFNFISTGKPVPAGSSYPAWPPADGSGSPYMLLNVTPQLVESPLLERRRRMWENIYEKYYRTPVPPPAPRGSNRSEL